MSAPSPSAPAPSRPTLRTRIARGAVVAVLTVAASVGLGVTPAQAEPYHHSHINKSWTPWTSPSSPGSQHWTIGRGTSVRMECWSTGAHRDGTAKWFRVRSNAYPFTRGFVPANSVSNQWTTSPRC